MYDYAPVTAKALDMIKKYGCSLTWGRKLKSSNQPTPANPKPWENPTLSTEEIPVSAVVFPATTGTAEVFDVDFEKDGVSADAYKYLIVAGEGRSTRPQSGDTFGLIEGKHGVVVGCKALDPSNSGAYILFEVGIKL